MQETQADGGSIPRLGRSPGGGDGNPLQYSCLENPMDEEPDGLQSMGLQRVEHDWSDWAHKYAINYKTYKENFTLSVINSPLPLASIIFFSVYLFSEIHTFL